MLTRGPSIAKVNIWVTSAQGSQGQGAFQLTCSIDSSDAEAQKYISSSGVQDTHNNRKRNYRKGASRREMVRALPEEV